MSFRPGLSANEIVIGSGLTALGLTLGFPADRRVLVVGGPASGAFSYYDGSRRHVNSYVGYGGLGTYWHGAISTAIGKPLHAGGKSFQELTRRFYPRTDFANHAGLPWLFVPWLPIRPKNEWRRLREERQGRLEVVHDLVTHITPSEREVVVHTPGGSYRAERVWLCAGPLHTPSLLNRSLGSVSRPFVSDHVFCYLGLIDRAQADVPAPRVTPHGRGRLVRTPIERRRSSRLLIAPGAFGVPTSGPRHGAASRLRRRDRQHGVKYRARRVAWPRG